MTGRRGLSIRAATAADLPGFSEILGLAGLRVPPTVLAGRLAAATEASGTVLAAWEWGPPSGIVALHWHAGLTADRPIARIDLLLVGPDDRRRGVGRLLLKAAAQAARTAGCGSLEFTVAEERADLVAFCEVTGFARTGSLFSRPLRKSG